MSADFRSLTLKAFSGSFPNIGFQFWPNIPLSNQFNGSSSSRGELDRVVYRILVVWIFLEELFCLIHRWHLSWHRRQVSTLRMKMQLCLSIQHPDFVLRWSLKPWCWISRMIKLIWKSGQEICNNVVFASEISDLDPKLRDKFDPLRLSVRRLFHCIKMH